MSVLELVKGRFSVRHFTSEPVNDDDLAVILETARFSQSAKNLQDWRFIIVRNESMKKKLAIAAKNQTFIEEAPVVLVCCGINIDYIMTCGQHAYSLDVAIAMENMCLAAHELKLGTCWIGAFYEDKVKELLSIPEQGVCVVGLLLIGHPAAQASPKRRETLDTIIKYERWK